VLAHDIPQRFFDRAIEVTIESQQVRVLYHLSLSRFTMADELLTLVGTGGLSGTVENERLELYASNMAPLLAHGLVVNINNRSVDLSVIRTSHIVEDHPRFQFEFAAAIDVTEYDVHQLQLEDTSFYLEKGRVRVSIQATPPCELQASSVPVRLDDVISKSAWEMTPEQQDAARRADARWTFSGAVPDPAYSNSTDAHPVSSSIDSPPRGVMHRVKDLTELLDSWSNRYLVILLGLAFIFGAGHALTPGHGKTMVAAYLVGERGTTRHAVALGLTTSMTHTSSVLGVALILRLVGRELQDKLSTGIALMSGLLVASLGAFLLLARLRGSMRQQSCAHDPGAGSEACGHAATNVEPAVQGPGWASLVTLGVSGGAMPCPDAIALLFIATAKGQVEQAVYLLLSFSAGLASALVLVGILAVKLRGFVASPMGSGRIVQSLPIVSAAAIFAVGVYLCLSTLAQPSFQSFLTPAATRTAGL
jgi:ABC-type nickel/cobalt efflux system permease component RcnA